MIVSPVANRGWDYITEKCYVIVQIFTNSNMAGCTGTFPGVSTETCIHMIHVSRTLPSLALKNVRAVQFTLAYAHTHT